MKIPNENNTMFDSVLQNGDIDKIYTDIITELSDQQLDNDQTVNALLATTSMGFNDLFKTLSKMVVNSYILDKYIDEKELSKEDVVVDISKKTIDLIVNIAQSIHNEKVEDIARNLNELMAKSDLDIQEENINESTTNTQNNENQSQDIS